MHVDVYGTPPGQEEDLGFLQFLIPLLGIASQVNASNNQKAAAESMARAAAEQRKAAEATARAKEAAARAQLQLALGQKKKLPRWAVPVGIGAGVLLLGGTTFFLLRR